MTVRTGPNLPPQGTPGILDPRNPTLVPNFDLSVASGNGTVDHVSPAGWFQANPRGDAAATALFGGVVTTGDDLTLVVTNNILSGVRFGSLQPAEIAHTYTTVGGDTVDTIAEAMADLFNDDPLAQAAGLRADPNGASVTFRWGGPVGNFATLTALLEPDTIQVGGTPTAGDTLNVLFAGPSFPGGHVVSYVVISGDSTTTLMATHLAAALNADAVLTALSISAAATGPNIALTIPAAAEPATVQVYANPGLSTGTVAGTPAAGNTILTTVTNATLPGGSHGVTYTVLLGDTTTTIAAGIAALINADPVFIAANITASPASAVVTFGFPLNIGAVTFAQTVTGGGATFTLAGATPTETLAYINSATEEIAINSGATPLVPATATATIGGSVTTSDTVAITFTNAGVTGLPVTETYTTVGGDTTTTIAAGLVALINASAVLQAAGIYAENVAAVITMSHEGTIGNSTVLSATVGGSATETVTFTPSNGHMAGGSGTVGNAFTGGTGAIVPTDNFTWHDAGTNSNYWYGKPEVPSYATITKMVNQGMPIL